MASVFLRNQGEKGTPARGNGAGDPSLTILTPDHAHPLTPFTILTILAPSPISPCTRHHPGHAPPVVERQVPNLASSPLKHFKQSYMSYRHRYWLSQLLATSCAMRGLKIIVAH